MERARLVLLHTVAGCACACVWGGRAAMVGRQCCRLGVPAHADLLPLIIARAQHVHNIGMRVGRRPPPATRHRTAGRRCWRRQGRAMQGPCTPRRTCEVNDVRLHPLAPAGGLSGLSQQLFGLGAGRREERGGEAGRRHGASRLGRRVGRRAGRCPRHGLTGLRTASSRRTGDG